MAIAFACPGCGKQFKVEDGMAGRKGKCPGCDATFQIPGAAPAPRTEVPAKTAPTRRPVDEDDEAPLPSRVRPEGRRRPPRDDEEDRPRRRPVEEDDYDDEDDRPRRRRRKKKQKSATGLILGIVAGAVVLLAVAGVAIWLLTRSGGGSTSVADDLKYLPDNSNGFFTFNIEALTASELYRRLNQETALLKQVEPPVLESIGLSFQDVQRITTGGLSGGGAPILVIRCKKPVTLSQLIAKNPAKYTQEDTIAGHKLRHDHSTGIAVPEGNTIVVGPFIAVQRVLERKGRKANLTPNLEAAFNNLDLSKVIAGALDLERDPEGGPQGRGAGGLQLPPIPGLQATPDAVTITADLGETATLALAGTCKNAAAAEALKKQLEAVVALYKGPIVPPNTPKEVTEIAKRIQMSADGNRLVANLTVEIGLLIEMAKKMSPKPGG